MNRRSAVVWTIIYLVAIFAAAWYVAGKWLFWW